MVMKILTTRTRKVIREIKLDRPISVRDAYKIYIRTVRELYDSGFKLDDDSELYQELDIDIEDCYFRAGCGTIYYKPKERAPKFMVYNPSVRRATIDESRLQVMECGEYWFDEGRMKPTGATVRFTWKDLDELEEVVV